MTVTIAVKDMTPMLAPTIIQVISNMLLSIPIDIETVVHMQTHLILYSCSQAGVLACKFNCPTVTYVV